MLLCCLIMGTRMTLPSAQVKSSSWVLFLSKSSFHCAAKSTTFCSARSIVVASSAEDSMRPAVFCLTHSLRTSWALSTSARRRSAENQYRTLSMKSWLTSVGSS